MNEKPQHANTTEVRNVSERVRETRREVEALKAELSRIISSGISNSKAFIPEFSRKNVNGQPEAQATCSNLPYNSSVPLNLSPRNPKPTASDKVPRQLSPKKDRSYDVAETREYIKKQRLKRNEKMKTQTKSTDNQIDLKKQKLQELQKKTRELVAKNVQLKKDRSKSRERVDPVRLDKAGPSSITNRAKSRDCLKNVDLPMPSQLRDRSKSRDKSGAIEKLPVAARDRSKSREKNLNNQKSPIPARSQSKLLHTNLADKKSPISPRGQIKPSHRDNLKISIQQRDRSKSRERNFLVDGADNQSKLRSKSRERNVLVDRVENQSKLNVGNSTNQKGSSEVSGQCLANQRAGIVGNNIGTRSSRRENFEGKLGKPQSNSSSQFLCVQNDVQERTKSNENGNSEDVGKAQEELIETRDKMNGQESHLNKFNVIKLPEVCQKETKETQTNQSKLPGTIWARPPAALPSPYNFINTVKRKLQYALTSPGNFVDVGIQSSVPLTPQKSAQEIKNLVNNASKIDLNSFASHKNLNLDVKTIEHLGLITKHSEKVKPVNENSESDTSKNIPEISSESGVSSRQSTQTNSDPKLSLEKLNNLKLQPHRLSGLVEPVKLFSKSSNEQTRNSYSSDFIDDLKSSGFNTRSSSIEDTSIPDILVAFNEGFVGSSNLEESASIEEINSNPKNDIDSQVAFNSLLTHSTSSYYPLKEPQISLSFNKNYQNNSKTLDDLTKTKSNVSRNSDKHEFDGIASKSLKQLSKTKSSTTIRSNSQLINSFSEKSCGSGNDNVSSEEIKTASLGSGDSIRSARSSHSESGYVVSKSSSDSKSNSMEKSGRSLVLREPPLSLNVRRGDEANGRATKNVTLRPNTSISSNANEIHLKFEAEVHLLNDFNESLKQFMAVEEAFEHLKRRDSNVAISKVFQNVDTQTSIITKTSSSATVQIPSRNSSINFSRGSEIASDNQNNNSIIPGGGRLSDFTLSTEWDLSNVNDTNSVMDNSNQVSFTNINDDNGAGVSLNMFELLIRDEDARLEHLRAVVKIREQALLDRTRSELVSLTIQRNRLLETGNAEEASALKKRQRAILVKLEEERNEMRRLKQKQKDNSSERKNILKQQRNLIKSQLSTSTMLPNMKVNTPKERRHSGPLRVVQSRSESIRSATSITENRRSGEGVLSVTSRSVSSLVSEEHCTDLNTSSVVKVENGVARLPRHPVSNLTRTLFMREAALRKRRREVEELLQWHRKLLGEEKKIFELEAAASSVINRKLKSTPETYQFTGKQLNQLWKNMTGRDDKHFVEDKLQVMSQGDLERFCKRARQFSGKNKKSDVTKRGILDVSGDIAGISGSDKTSNGDYSSEFEPESVQEIIESQEKQKISSISELIENFNKIEAEISRKSDSRGSLLSRSLEDGSRQAQEVDSSPVASERLDSEILTNKELSSRNSSSSVSDHSKDVPSQITVPEEVLVSTVMTPSHFSQVSAEAETGESLEVTTSSHRPKELGPVSEEVVFSPKSKHKSKSSTEEESRPDSEKIIASLESSRASIEEESRSSTEEIITSKSKSLTEEEPESRTEEIMVPLKTKWLSKSFVNQRSESVIEEAESALKSSKSEVGSKSSIEEEFRLSQQIVPSSKSASLIDQESRSGIDEVIDLSKSQHVSASLVKEKCDSGELLESNSFHEQVINKLASIKETNISEDITSNGCVSEEEISEKAETEELVTVDQSGRTITYGVDEENLPEIDKATSVEEVIDLTEDSLLNVSSDLVVPNSVQDNEESEETFESYRTRECSDKETINSDISELSKPPSLDNIKDKIVLCDEAFKTGSEETPLITNQVLAEKGKVVDEIASFEGETPDTVSDDKEVSGEESVTSKICSGITNGESVHSEIEEEEESYQVLGSKNSKSALTGVSETEEDRSKSLSNGLTSYLEPEASSEDNETKSSSTLKQPSKEEFSVEEKEEDVVLSVESLSKTSGSSPKSSGTSIGTETDQKTPVKKNNNQVDVKKRVSEILADVNIVSRGDKSPRLQDLYVTTYDIAPATSPEGAAGEAKKVPGSIFGSEAEELLRKQLAIEQEIKQLEQQQKAHLPYVYMREIPNKPPPPYTPPSAPAISHSICPTDPKEIDDITNYTSKVIYKAYQSNNLDNVKFSERSFKLISKLDIGKTCCEFVFNICKEIACEHYRQFETIEEPSWLTVTKKPQLAKVKPLDGPGLERYMNGKLKELFGFKKLEITESANIKWGRKKRDHVDEILVQELQEEESQWTNFDKDELIVKDQITNDIMVMLIDETVDIFSEILAKRRNFN